MHGRNSISSPSSKVKWLAALAIAAAAAGTARATVVFSDGFNNGSTLEPGTYPTVTSNSTGYDIASAKDSNPADSDSSLSTGDLKITLPATSSAVVEAEALFTGSPVTLTSGESITLSTTFTDTAGSPGATYFGLFNSGSSAPSNNLSNGSSAGTGANSGLSSTQTTVATGGAKGWAGYSVQLQATASSHLEARAAQTGTNNTVQDVLATGASSSQAYTTPSGTVLGTSTTNAVQTLVAGDVYTEDFIVALNSGVISVTSDLYAGSTATGTPLATQTANDANALTTTFDAFAFGWRETNSVAPTMDYNSVSVSTAVAPEPASLGLIALGALALRRRK